jgi:sRNA-binding protein
MITNSFTVWGRTSSVTGTAEDLDAELSKTIVGFVGAHLQMKNTLERAKAEMDAASKAAQAEARAKSKTTAKPVPPKAENAQPAATAKPAEPVKPTPLKTASLFDLPAPAATPTAAPDESEEDDEPFVEIEDDEPVDDIEELDDAA